MLQHLLPRHLHLCRRITSLKWSNRRITTASFKWSNRAASPLTILGLDKTTKAPPTSEIDIAYRKILLQVHPDHGGTTEMFMRVKQARDTLVAQNGNSNEFTISSTGDIEKKTLEKQFSDALQTKDLEQTWNIWTIILGVSEDPVTIKVLETYLDLLTKTNTEATAGTTGTAGTGVVRTDRWGGLLLAMDAFQTLKESNRFTSEEEEARAWNGLLWHLSQLPEGWSAMNDTLIVLKKMDDLNVTPDLDLLESSIFTFFPKKNN